MSNPEVNERTLYALQLNLRKTHTLTYDNMLAMDDAFGYGTATPMIALIKTLKLIYKEVDKGNTVFYVDENSNKCSIDKNNFNDFVYRYFDEFVLKEVFDDTSELYK